MHTLGYQLHYPRFRLPFPRPLVPLQTFALLKYRAGAMKYLAVLLISTLAVAADAPTLPLIFVKAESSYVSQGGLFSGSTSHRDQGIQAIDFLQRGCHGLTVTMDETKADFIMQMNHQDDGSLGIGNRTQVMVSKRDGSLVKVAETQSIVGAVNNVCKTLTGEKLHK